jgi:hypothetical protein
MKGRAAVLGLPGLWEWGQADAIVCLPSIKIYSSALINDKSGFAVAAGHFSASRHKCAEFMITLAAQG